MSSAPRHYDVRLILGQIKVRLALVSSRSHHPNRKSFKLHTSKMQNVINPQQSPNIVKIWYRLLRIAFRLLYNEMAWTYDFVSWCVSLGHWRSWQRTCINELTSTIKSQTILELAHGTANLQIDLNAAGFRTIGLDISPAMGKIANRKLTKARAPAKLVRASALHLPFGDGEFGAVVSTFPTEFILDNTTVREVFRVLAQEGRLIIVLSASLAPVNLLVAVINWLYNVTGQTLEAGERNLDPFRSVGFASHLTTVNSGQDKVVLLVADKSLKVATH